MSKQQKTSMEFDFKTVDNQQLAKECDSLIKEFEKLIDSVDHKHFKKKFLWKQIFSSALEDRRNAYIMFNNLYLEVHGNPDLHLTNGQILHKYHERMSKATDQLLRLLELMNDALTMEEEIVEEDINEDDMYEKLKEKQK